VTTPASIQFDVWIAALDSGYVTHDAFTRWADRRIDVDPFQSRWILDLSLSRDADEATRVLRIEWSRQSDSPARDLPLLCEPAGLHLGFLYLAFEGGQVSMDELLLAAGRYADNKACGQVPECEAFYLLLNEIDGGGPTRKSDRPLPDRVAELFAPLAAQARSALPHLPD
jgi:hypothetical protein